MDRLATVVFTTEEFGERQLGTRISQSIAKMDRSAALPRFAHAVFSPRYLSANASDIKSRI